MRLTRPPTWRSSCSAASASSPHPTSPTWDRRSVRSPSIRRRGRAPPRRWSTTSAAVRFRCLSSRKHTMTSYCDSPAMPSLGGGPDTTDQILSLYRTHLSKGRATVAELFGAHMEVASEGAWLWTSDGERFLNCGGYGVFIMGAKHPVVMDAVRRQLETHPVATRILLEPTVARAAEALTSVVPADLNRVHFGLGGAEAVETGLKLARANGRRRLVSMRQGYHGKSLGALSATAKEVYQKPFRPLLPDVTHVPFGDAAALEAALAPHPGEVCVIVEPVQGEGGVVLPPPGYR